MTGAAAATALAPSVAEPPRREPQRGSRPSGGSGFFGPGWPLVALFAGMPLWWVLGLQEFAFLIFTLPMALTLVRQTHLRVPRGFGVWLLFLVWLISGVFVLQVDAPGAVPGNSAGRYLTFTYRALWYLCATIVLLYIGNTRKTLPTRRITRALSYMFVVLVAGGLLGVLLPHLQFPSLLEMALPRSLATNGFIKSLIHPASAQVQDFLGYAEARPSAPFTFTNEWGLAIACTLPFFVIEWLRRGAGWRRVVAPLVLAAAAIPIVSSLNRGMWLALIASGLFVVVRLAVMGRGRALAGLTVCLLLGAGLVAVSPLGSLIVDRLETPHSNQGRTNLGTLTAESALSGSPVIGFGSTRDVQGNFVSIAAGATAQCPKCSPPPLGTQGQLWLLLFATGLGGTLLYVGFLLIQAMTHLRLPSPTAIAANCVLVSQFVTMPVYGAVGPGLFLGMIAIGLLWRERALHTALRPGTTTTVDRAAGTLVDRPLSALTGPINRRLLPIIALTVAGALLGVGYQAWQGSPVYGRQSVFVPGEARAIPGVRSLSMDSEAQLAKSDPVVAAVARAVGSNETHQEIRSRIRVTAQTNTRILNIRYQDTNADRARRGVEAAVNALLASRAETIRTSHDATLKRLEQQNTVLNKQVSTTRQVIDDAGNSVNPQLRKRLSGLVYQQRQTAATIARIRSTPSPAGEVTSGVVIAEPRDGYLKKGGSGLMLGLVLGMVLAFYAGQSKRRLGRRPSPRVLGDLPILGRVDVAHAAEGSMPITVNTEGLGTGLARYSPIAMFWGDGRDPRACRAAALLNHEAATLSTGFSRAVIVASPRTRANELNQMRRDLRRVDLDPVGVVIAE